ncbi:MAG: HAMP domain-containing protein [Ruminiclostridium sp.]|nr:HAMP domain-containing protein [Ruminiclostridium sp.]
MAERPAQMGQTVQNPRPGQNQQASAPNIRMTKGMRRRAMRKAGFSMSRRISASYIRMVVDAFLSSLVLMLIVFIAYHSFALALDVKQISEDISTTQSIKETVYDIAMQRDTEISLSDTSGEILVNTFGLWQKPYDRLPIWFYRRGNAVFIMIQNWASRTEGLYIINVFRDITPILTELVVLFGFVVFLGASVLLTIYLRGRSVTRNVLYPIAEVTKMTKEIKGQNLNLRLNVTNAKDELKELIITFNEMMDRIENAYNKQNQFVSDASHELRTPISVIQGYARMLERWGKEDPEVLQESIEAIRNESENMKELVDKLLFIARNDKDTLILTKETFSLSEMMEELVKETKMVNELHTIEGLVEQEIETNGDRSRIKQAMRIFVDNAQKYTEPGKTVTISLKREGNMAVLSVKDSGCGISANDLQNVFDRFFRADESRDRNKGGHGLGLSIAKIIVLRHGGKLNVRSKVGEGSVFSIILNIEPKAEKTGVE